MALTRKAFDEASARAAARLRHGPRVLRARFDRARAKIVVQLSSGIDLAFRPRDVQGLRGATAAGLARIEISPSGLGLHFPDIDADVHVPSLLAGLTGSDRWMAVEHGRAGGRATSPAKAEAARRNGSLGGRPRKARTSAA